MTAIDPRPIVAQFRRPPATDPFTVEGMVTVVLSAIDAAGLTVVDTRHPDTVTTVERAVQFSITGRPDQYRSVALTVLDALR